MKYAVYFSRVFTDKTDRRWGEVQINYALTKIAPFIDGSFDVFFFAGTDDQAYIDSLQQRYPWLNVVQFTPVDFGAFSSTMTFHIWYNLEFFANSDYDQVLYLDTDTFFNKSPIGLFEKYADLDGIRSPFYLNFTVNIEFTRKWLNLNKNTDLEHTIFNGSYIYSGFGRCASMLPTFSDSNHINAAGMLFKNQHLQLVRGEIKDLITKYYELFKRDMYDLVQRGIITYPSLRVKLLNWQSGEVIGGKMFEDAGAEWYPFTDADINMDFTNKETSAFVTHYTASLHNMNTVGDGKATPTISTIIPADFIRQYVEDFEE